MQKLIKFPFGTKIYIGLTTGILDILASKIVFNLTITEILLLKFFKEFPKRNFNFSYLVESYLKSRIDKIREQPICKFGKTEVMSTEKKISRVVSKEVADSKKIKNLTDEIFKNNSQYKKSDLLHVDLIVDYLIEHKDRQYGLEYDTYGKILKEKVFVTEDDKLKFKEFKKEWFPDENSGKDTENSKKYAKEIKRLFDLKIKDK